MSGARVWIGLALALALSACSGVALPPFVLVAVLDTTRFDHLPIYGSARNTAPALAELAREGLVFERAIVTAPWTVPSHASMFSGQLPGVLDVGWGKVHLPPDIPLMAEHFQRAGYRTIGISQNPMLVPAAGFARGFDHWSNVGGGKSRTRLVEALRAESTRPVFVFVNLIAPHLPYFPAPAEWAEFVSDSSPRTKRLAQSNWKRLLRMRSEGTLSDSDLDRLGELYDGEIKVADTELAGLLAELRSTRPGDGIVVVTADHGENIGDHGLFDHQLGVQNSLLHVPLVLHAPGRLAPGRVGKAVSLRDLWRTLAVLAALPEQQEVPGVSWVDAAAEAQPVVSEYERPVPILEGVASCCPAVDASRFDRVLAAAQDAAFKLVLASDGTRMLYDLEQDPSEANDLLAAPALTPTASAALARLEPVARRSLDSRAGRSVAPSLSAEDRERLRSLGYIDDEQ